MREKAVSRAAPPPSDPPEGVVARALALIEEETRGWVQARPPRPVLPPETAAARPGSQA